MLIILVILGLMALLALWTSLYSPMLAAAIAGTVFLLAAVCAVVFMVLLVFAVNLGPISYVLILYFSTLSGLALLAAYLFAKTTKQVMAIND